MCYSFDVSIEIKFNLLSSHVMCNVHSMWKTNDSNIVAKIPHKNIISKATNQLCYIKTCLKKHFCNLVLGEKFKCVFVCVCILNLTYKAHNCDIPIVIQFRVICSACVVNRWMSEIINERYSPPKWQMWLVYLGSQTFQAGMVLSRTQSQSFTLRSMSFTCDDLEVVTSRRNTALYMSAVIGPAGNGPNQ